MRKAWPLVVLFAAGCGRATEDWQPLTMNAEWKYQIRAGLLTSVDSVRVQREISVAGERGASLSTPGGETRLVWKEGALLAEFLGGTRYAPPIPILIPELPEKKSVPWRGIVTTGHRSFGGQATLTMQPDTYLLAEKKTDALRSNLEIVVNQQTIEISTWYVREIGMVRQEERTRDLLVRAVEYVSGP